jgi:transposase
MNRRPLQKLGVSREHLFHLSDRPALKPLPVEPYPYADRRLVRVGLDYHVELAGHAYSVPHALINEQLDIRLTTATIECFFKGKRVASHALSHILGGKTTLDDHMPQSHRRHREWTPAKLGEWAQGIGPQTAQFVASLLTSRPHPEQGFRSALGAMRLAKSFTPERIEAACARAFAIQALSAKSLKSILEHGLDRLPLTEPPAPEPIQHANIRGPLYYQDFQNGVASC